MKNKLALLFYYTGFSWLLFHISRLWYGREHIRVVNYHATPSSLAQNFENQLRFYSKYYSNTNAEDLKKFLNTKEWEKNKPGLIISFDDGLKNNKTVAVPLLEKYGFNGWFCIPPEFTKKNQKLAVPADSNLEMYGHTMSAIESVSMNESEILEISKDHEIICHTDTHLRLSKDVSDLQILNRELIESKKKLESIISRDIEGFCWVGGEFENYSLKAHNIIKNNYKYSFQTNNHPILKTTDRYFIDRNNIEVWFSFPFLLLTLSGFYDILYRNKRIKIKNALSEK